MLKNTKRKLFTTTTKAICCSLLTTGLLLQAGTTPVFADSYGQNIVNTNILLASHTSENDLQIMNILEI